MVDLLHVTMGTDLKDLRILCISMKKTTLFIYSKHNHIELLIHSIIKRVSNVPVEL